jgi:hypothetical protein
MKIFHDGAVDYRREKYPFNSPKRSSSFSRKIFYEAMMVCRKGRFSWLLPI